MLRLLFTLLYAGLVIASAVALWRGQDWLPVLFLSLALNCLDRGSDTLLTLRHLPRPLRPRERASGGIAMAVFVCGAVALGLATIQVLGGPRVVGFPIIGLLSLVALLSTGASLFLPANVAESPARG